MNKLFILLIAFLSFSSLVAQDGKNALKKATKTFAAFNLDQANKAKLVEAYDNIVVAANDAETSAMVKTWLLKGEITNEISNQIAAIKQLGIGSVDELPKAENPAIEAYEAYNKVIEMHEKKYELKDALTGLRLAQGNLNNMGIYAYEQNDYEKAYGNFMAALDAHKILKKNGKDSAFDASVGTEDPYKQQLYIAGLSALNADKVDDAKMCFTELYDAGYNEPAVYEAMYKISSKDDLEGAYKYIVEGRAKFPDDVSLMFADINHYLKQGKMKELIGKLETAIEKEPENVSLYSTLGNVYDNLFQASMEKGEKDKSNEYFELAMENYQKALAMQSDFGDAIYSIGALYYNRAAALTKELGELESDYSKAGLAKYEAKTKEIFAEFDKALPYFKDSERINPNDINTMIALKEIFARKNDLETSNEFKGRLENVQNGGVNESYFKDKQ